MKKYSHAWIAFMAIKRLEVIASTDNKDVINDVTKEIRTEAKALVKWFMDYRDFVIQGSWYPDEVFKDMSTSHIVKYSPSNNGPYTTFGNLPATHSIYTMMKEHLAELGTPYKHESGNCADRCEAFAQSIIDNFKMLYKEDRGCPIATTGNHIAMRFFILSHYVADCHMPLHCDVRSYSDGKNIHSAIENEWEKVVKASYKIDNDNNRFFYDPEGYPLHLNPSQFAKDVENDISTRKYIHKWGDGNNNIWDFMSVVSQYSYLFSRYLIPESFGNEQTMTSFKKKTEWGRNFDKYSKMIIGDAIDAVARIWLHVWIKFRSWEKKLK